MTSGLLQSAAILHELSSTESAKLLLRALAPGQPVRIQTGNANHTLATGTVRHAARNIVKIKLDQAPPTDINLLITLDLDGTPYAMQIDGRQGSFDRSTDEFTTPSPLRIARIERRRSRRRTLQQHRPMALHLPSGSRVEATMLNLSADGLACKIDAKADVSAGHRVTATLQTSATDTLELCATVVSVTPLASKDAVAVGLEFNHNPSQRDQLQHLLDCHNEPTTGDRWS